MVPNKVTILELLNNGCQVCTVDIRKAHRWKCAIARSLKSPWISKYKVFFLKGSWIVAKMSFFNHYWLPRRLLLGNKSIDWLRLNINNVFGDLLISVYLVQDGLIWRVKLFFPIWKLEWVFQRCRFLLKTPWIKRFEICMIPVLRT